MSLTNPQMEKIARRYDQIRAAQREDQQRRIEEAFSKVPGLFETEQAIVDLSFARARVKLSAARKGERPSESSDGLTVSAPGKDERSSDGTEDEILKKLKSLREARSRMLKEGGFPEDQLNLRYRCPYCNDTGYVDGKKCICFRRMESELFFSQQPVRAKLEADTFERFRLDFYENDRIGEDEESPREHMEAILKDSLRYVKEFRPGEENLLLMGQTGTGKTFLSHCIAGELIRKGFSVVLLSSEELFRVLADHAMGRDREEDGAWRLAMDADFLVIDDLGTEVNNTLVSSQLFSCMERRSLTGKSTLISTNLTLDSIRNRYSERVLSRIIESYTVYDLYNYDSDIRFKVRQERQRRLEDERQINN